METRKNIKGTARLKVPIQGRITINNTYAFTSFVLWRDLRLNPGIIGTVGPKSDANGEWRRLRNEELYSFYRSPKIVRVIMSRRLRWTGHVARMATGTPAGKRP